MYPPRVILAAVDFSDGSRAALMVAAQMAMQSGAALHVVNAPDPLLEAAGRAQGLDLQRDSSRELSAFIASALHDDAQVVTEHVVVGPAANVVCDLARSESADVVVVGATGMSGPERVVFGSTAERIVRRAGTSVLVVRG